MTAAGENCAAVVGCPHIAGKVRAARSGAKHSGVGSYLIRRGLRDHGMRNGIVVQAGNMRHGNAQIERRFAIRRIKDAVLSGMLVVPHPHIECLLDLRNRAADGHNHPICGRAGDGKSIGLGKIDYSLVVLCSGAELLSELINAEEMAVIGAGWIVEPAQQAGQFALVAQRQHDGEIQLLRLRQRARQRRLSAGDCGANMMTQYLERLLSLIGGGEKGKGRKDKKTSEDPELHG